MYRHAVWAMLLILLVAGCRQPLRVRTDSNITVAGISPQDMGPVVPMAVTPGDPSQRRIALVDVDGLLLNQDLVGLYSEGENPVSLFREKLDSIARQPCYAAVVVRINSPGGSVTASDILWHDLRAFKARTGLPVVVCLMDVGAGGAYYLASAADHIVAHPTTVTGGIGVILNLYYMEDAMAQSNVFGVPVKSGEHIDLGTPIRQQTEADRAILQQMAREFHNRFRDVVLEGRPQLNHAPPEIFDGRIFTARRSHELGLIDSVGYLSDAAEIAGQLGGAPGAPLVILHRRHDRARTPYDATANVPVHNSFLPFSMPGLERSRLPAFLYLWQPDPTIERFSGR